ncbi:MAG: tagaturonate reductase [Oscillospiraceae bacterium]
MKKLSYATLKEQQYNGYLLKNAPERILQFGEGNFLRAFVDYFVDMANEKCAFNSKVVLCQPIEQGLAQMINEQEGLYTLYLRGFENGEKVNDKRVISAVSRCINPYEDYAALLQCAHNADLRYIASNTTEAGIAFDDECKFDDAPPASFPAKLTRFMYERYMAMGSENGKGFVILSCELIDNNGAELLKCVHQYIDLWALPQEFANWVDKENIFCSTLVDRIVTGYPRSEKEQLNDENGYEDNLLDTAEVFGLWVIEGPESLAQELPFAKAGLPVLVTNDHTPYKKRKVRILNGAHTAMVPAAYLSGQTIVRDCMQDEIIKGFMDKCVYDEIIPTLTLPKKELEAFAAAVGERFNNPFIDHSLLAIALNSTSKWKARVLPSLKAFVENTGKLPLCLTLSLAALIEFYRKETGKNAKDDAWILEFYAAHQNADNTTITKAVLTNEKMWDEDLTKITGLEKAVIKALDAIDKDGMYAALKSTL